MNKTRGWAVFPNIVAGLTSGLVAVVYSVSFAALIFSEKLTPFFAQGVGTALVGATVTAIVVALKGPFPFAIAGPEANSAIVVALAARAIASGLAGSEERIYPTIWAAIVITSVANGLFLYLLGRFRLGQFARYVPYPVIGGFLAGTGCLIAKSSFKVMTGVPLTWIELPRLVEPGLALQWLAGLAVAAVLVLILTRFRHFLVLPVFLLSGILLATVAQSLLRSTAFNLDNWFFAPFSQAGIWNAWRFSTLAAVDWSVLGHQSGLFMAMMAIVMLSILLNATGLELATGRSVDLNDELRADGVANLVNGLCGGMVGYLSVNRCLLNQRAGATSPLAGIVAGLFCAAALIGGSSFLSHVPKPLLGGLLLYIGYNLLVRWLYSSWRQLPRFDYFLVVLILVIIVAVGFIPGIGAGIVIACLLFIVNYGRTSSIKYCLSGRTYRSNVVRSPDQERALEESGDSVLILVLHGFLFFGTANDLLERVRSRLGEPGRERLRAVIFDFRLVTGLDSSAVLSFIKLGQIADKADLALILTQLDSKAEAQLTRGGVRGREGMTYKFLPDLDRGMEWCEDRLLPTSASSNSHPTDETRLKAQLESFLKDPGCAERLLPYLKRADVRAREYLFKQGDPSHSLYLLFAGRVSVILEVENGTTLRRRTYTGGTILGEMGFFSGATRSASVMADEGSTLYELSSEAFKRVEEELPSVAANFNRAVINLLAERLRRSEEEVKTLVG